MYACVREKERVVIYTSILNSFNESFYTQTRQVYRDLDNRLIRMDYNGIQVSIDDVSVST